MLKTTSKKLPKNYTVVEKNATQMDTLRHMVEMARNEAFSSFVAGASKKLNLTRSLDSLKTVFDLVFFNTVFLPDGPDLQTIRTPRAILRDKVANCVDYSTTLAAFCIYLNIPCAFVLASFDDSRNYSHVYLLVNGVLPIDCVIGQTDGTRKFRKPDFGAEAPGIKNKYILPINYRI